MADIHFHVYPTDMSITTDRQTNSQTYILLLYLLHPVTPSNQDMSMPPPPQRLATKDMYSFKQGKTILTDEQTDIHILYLADITVFCTSCNSIQPGHVNASTSPEAGHEGHVLF